MVGLDQPGADGGVGVRVVRSCGRIDERAPGGGGFFSAGILWVVLLQTDFGGAWLIRALLLVLLAAVFAFALTTKPKRSAAIWLNVIAAAMAAGLVGILAWGGHAAGGAGTEGIVHRSNARSPTGPNVAARLEAANKQLGTRVCVSATLADKVEDFHGRPIGDLVLRGKTEPLRAFEPLRREQYDDPATASYLEAFAKLEVGDPGTIAAFAAHVGKLPTDQLASFHLKRLLNGATGTRIALD